MCSDVDKFKRNKLLLCNCDNGKDHVFAMKMLSGFLSFVPSERPALRLIRRHERCSKKHARYANHLTFLVRCVKNNVIPKDLRIKSPVPTKGARRAAELVAKRFLRERIRLTHRARDINMREVNATASQIRTTLSAEDSCEILTKIKDTAQAIHESCKSRQQCKFLQLMEEKQPATIESNQVDKTGFSIFLPDP